MKETAAAVRSCLRVILTGPPAPRRSVSPSSQSSSFLKAGSTSSYAQPLQPSSAQSSKFFRLPRTKSMPLIELEPPSTLPRVWGMVRSQACFCGVDV